MSHYIQASWAGGGTILSGGTSWRTLAAMENTGFDLYAVFGSTNTGSWSGQGISQPVPHEVAREAFLTAVAWIKAVRQYVDRDDARSGDGDVPDTEDRMFGVPIWRLIGLTLQDLHESREDELIPSEICQVDLEDADLRVASLLQELGETPPDAEDLQRSLGMMELVSSFTWRVYQLSRTATVTLHFD